MNAVFMKHSRFDFWSPCGMTQDSISEGVA